MVSCVIGRNILQIGDPVFVAVASQCPSVESVLSTDGLSVFIRDATTEDRSGVERKLRIISTRGRVAYFGGDTSDLPMGTYDVIIATPEEEIGVGDSLQFLDKATVGLLTAHVVDGPAVPQMTGEEIRRYVQGLQREYVMPLESLLIGGIEKPEFVVRSANNVDWRIEDSAIFADPKIALQLADDFFAEVGYLLAAGAFGLSVTVYVNGSSMVLFGLISLPNDTELIRRYLEHTETRLNGVTLEIRGTHIALTATVKSDVMIEVAIAGGISRRSTSTGTRVRSIIKNYNTSVYRSVGTEIPDDNERHSLQTYVSDLLALERDIGKPLVGQLASDATKQYASALSVVQTIKTQNDAHQAALEQCLYALGGHPANPIKPAWSSLLGGAARKTKVSKWLRDDYTALGLVTMRYTLLHATAVGLGDSVTAAVAKQGLADYARSVMQLNQVVPEVVLGELTEDGETVQTGAAETIRRQTNEVWKSQSSVAN
jgi:hypothetical protein